MTQEVLAGGYPEMRQRRTAARRQAWARAYITTLIERDIQDVAQIWMPGCSPPSHGSHQSPGSCRITAIKTSLRWTLYWNPRHAS